MNLSLLETSRALCQAYGDSVPQHYEQGHTTVCGLSAIKVPIATVFPASPRIPRAKQFLECSITAQWQRPLWCSLQRHRAGVRGPLYSRHFLGRCARQSMKNSSPLEVPVPIIPSNYNPVLADNAQASFYSHCSLPFLVSSIKSLRFQFLLAPLPTFLCCLHLLLTWCP